VQDAEIVVAPRDGPLRILLASGQRLADEDSRTLGAVVSMRDVTEQRDADRQLREAAADLRRANIELERSNEELEKFAYVASHDLQEPLRKIQAFGDRLRDRCRDELPEFGREYVNRMLTSAGRMRRLIDDLLMLSRVTTQPRQFRPVELGKLVEEVVSDLDVRFAEVGGRARVGLLPVVEANPTQMRQLFQNLIANAVKFHRPGEPVVVEIEGELTGPPTTNPGGGLGPVCRITLRDNGIGFDNKYRERIFEVFQRLHGRDAYEGTGVGLAICRKIVERHGGTINAHGREGVGATFVVDLPVHQPEVRELAGSDAEPNKTDHHSGGR
jgi:light-regulated signal transduction histidine kinase (bacteriophytochrome)